jgi:protein-S-isoprenylcysteine O-methyltransferase Ste14
MQGEARREAERPPWFAVIGTILLAPLFAGSVIVLGPYLLSGWKLDAPFFGWAPSRWVGVALVILPIPPLLDFLVRFVREGHGTPAPFAPPRHLVVSGSFRYVRNPAYLCAVMMLVGQGLFLASTSVLLYAAVVALAFHLYEEPTLRATFGAEYMAYCREVPRWIPRLTPAIRRGDSTSD